MKFDDRIDGLNKPKRKPKLKSRCATCSSSFFSCLAGHRGLLRTYVPGFRGISSLRCGIPRPCTTALPLSTDFSCQTGKKTSCWRENPMTNITANVGTIEHIDPNLIAVEANVRTEAQFGRGFVTSIRRSPSDYTTHAQLTHVVER